MKFALSLLILWTLAAPAPAQASGFRAVLERREGEPQVRDLPERDEDPSGWLGGDRIALSLSGTRPLSTDGSTEAWAQVQLANGDPLRGLVLGGTGEELSLELMGASRLSIAIEDLAWLRFPRRIPQQWGLSLEAPLEGDRLYILTGGAVDWVDGAILSFSDEGIEFESVLGEQLYAWEDLVGAFVEAFEEGDSAEREAGTPVTVDLYDGSRLRGGLAGVDWDGVRLRRGGSELRLALGAVSEILLADGSVDHLSTLVPVSAEEGSPFGDEIGMVWRHRVDRSVSDTPLSVGGRVFTRGIGVHAPSRLTYDLGGEWRWLRGAVGLDDVVARLPARGSVIFRVRLDGELAWESPVRRGGDALLELPALDLADVERLTLEVDMAADLHMGDRADWLRMLLVR